MCRVNLINLAWMAFSSRVLARRFFVPGAGATTGAPAGAGGSVGGVTVGATDWRSSSDSSESVSDAGVAAGTSGVADGAGVVGTWFAVSARRRFSFWTCWTADSLAALLGSFTAGGVGGGVGTSVLGWGGWIWVTAFGAGADLAAVHGPLGATMGAGASVLSAGASVTSAGASVLSAMLPLGNAGTAGFLDLLFLFLQAFDLWWLGNLIMRRCLDSRDTPPNPFLRCFKARSWYKRLGH